MSNQKTQTKTIEDNYILQDYYNRAYNAYRNISFDPDKRAESIVREYSELLTEDLKQYTDDETKRIYKERFINKLLAWLDAKSRTASPMITGPARFPVERNLKALEIEMKRNEEFIKFRKTFYSRYEKKQTTVIDPEKKAKEIHQKRKDNILENMLLIKAIDKKEQTGFNRNLFINGITNLCLKTIAKEGNKARSEDILNLIKKHNNGADYVKPIFTKKHRIFTLLEVTEQYREETNNRQNKELKILTFEGFKVLFNYEIDRLQIQHDEKPKVEIIQSLKKNAFRWSPSQKVWQRQLTQNAISATQRIFNITL